MATRGYAGFQQPIFPIQPDTNRSYATEPVVTPWKFPQGGGNFPFYDAATQTYRNMGSGELFTGDIPGGAYAQAGRIVPKPAAATPAGPPAVKIDPATGKPADAPRMLEYVEQPAVAALAQKGIERLPAEAQETRSYFDEYKASADAARAQAKVTGARAYDTTGTETAIQGQLADQNAASAEQIARMEANLKESEARQNALVAQDRAAVEDSYRNIRALAEQSYGARLRGQSARQLASPVNSMASSGALRGNAARAYNEAFIPAEREILDIGRGITGIERGNEAQRFAAEQDQGRFNIGVAERAAQLGINAEQYMANLKLQVQNMSVDELFRFLTIQENIPMISDRLRDNQVSIEQKYAILDRFAKQFTYYQPFDPSRIPPTAQTFYPQALPARSYSNPTEPSGPRGPGGGQQVLPGDQGTGPTDPTDDQIMANPSLNWERYQEIKARYLAGLQQPQYLRPGVSSVPAGAVTMGDRSYLPGAAPYFGPFGTPPAADEGYWSPPLELVP